MPQYPDEQKWAVTINHVVSINCEAWPKPWVYRDALMRLDYFKGLSIISQKAVKGQSFLHSGEGLNTPSLHPKPAKLTF